MKGVHSKVVFLLLLTEVEMLQQADLTAHLSDMSCEIPKARLYVMTIHLHISSTWERLMKWLPQEIFKLLAHGESHGRRMKWAVEELLDPVAGINARHGHCDPRRQQRDNVTSLFMGSHESTAPIKHY